MNQTKSAKYDLTQGPIVKTLLLYATPIIVSALIQYLYHVFDTAMVGSVLGEIQMGAVSSAGTTCGLLYSLAGGFCSGIAVVVGINFGAKNEAETLRAIFWAEILSLCLGLILMTAGLLLIPTLLKITKVPEYAYEYAKTYISIIIGSAVVSMFNNMHTHLLRTLGDSKSPVYMLIASAVVNVVLNLVFMLVFRMGVAGVAIATVISQAVSGGMALVFFLKHYPQFNFFRIRIPQGEKIWLQELRMGIPMAFQQSMIMIGAVIVQTKVNSMDSPEVPIMASYAASNNINNITSTIINTFGMVTSGFVSQNFGARKFDRISRGMKCIMLISGAIAAVLAVVLLVFTKPIVSLFMDSWNEAIYLNVRDFIRLNVLFYAIWVPVPVLRCAIQSMKHPALSFGSCLVELPMRCITAWVLSDALGFKGLALSTPCAVVAAFLFLIVAFVFVWRKQMKINAVQNG